MVSLCRNIFLTQNPKQCPSWVGGSPPSSHSGKQAPPILEGLMTLKVACFSTASQQMKQRPGESWVGVMKARTECITESWALYLTSLCLSACTQSLFPQLYIQTHGLMTLTGFHSTLRFNAKSTEFSNCLSQGQAGRWSPNTEITIANLH